VQEEGGESPVQPKDKQTIFKELCEEMFYFNVHFQTVGKLYAKLKQEALLSEEDEKVKELKAKIQEYREKQEKEI